MSKMLEQAIIDAEALKEAALKNAEAAVVEKYSHEVREVVDQLLEQPEDEMGAEIAAPVADEFPDMPRADVAGENVCPCPDEEEEVEIDFDALAQQMDAEEEGEMIDRDELVDDLMEEEEQIDEDQDLDEITEALVAELLEELTVDVEAVPTGQAGGASNAALDREQVEIALAQLAQEEAQGEAMKHEENALEEEKEELEEALNAAKSTNDELVTENKELKSLLVRVKDRLEEVNLSNARLLYTNRILSSTSLNERQKNKIVESISKSESVEEAKVIFETLQSATGDSKRQPKSLSEVVSRPSTTLPRREKRGNISDPVTNRWKALAGIDKK
jgi:hypothetical protein